jgi:single-strand DNA-binding protein
MNKWIGIGRLTKDPTLKEVGSEKISVATFTIAVDRKFKNKDGDKEADFIPIVVWRKTAELCAKYLSKGARVGICGTIQTRKYESEGEMKYITEVVADEVQFIDTKKIDDRTLTEVLENDSEFTQLSDVPF